MSKETYATNGEYYLVRLTEGDRDKYMALKRQVTTSTVYYDDTMLAKIMWESAIDGKDKNFSVYNKNDEYCGNVSLQNYDNKTPEIGVNILEIHRNKGIAGKVIKLLAKQDYGEQEREHYLLRVSSRNTHSKHMIEKLGAILIAIEESQYKTFMRQLQKIAGEEDLRDISERIKRHFDEDDDKEEEVVYRYKLTPELFM